MTSKPSEQLDGQLVNAGPFVLQEAAVLFKNDLDLTFGDSRLHDYTMLQFLTIFSAALPCYSAIAYMLPSALMQTQLFSSHKK